MSTDRNSVRYEWVTINELRPNKIQLRRHNRHQRRKIATLLKLAGGQIIPLITTPDYEIIDGHALYEQLKEDGAQQVYVAILLNQTPADLRALRLAINRLPEDSRWDKAQLKIEFSELIELSYDTEATGFDPPEIDALLELDIPTTNTFEDADRIPSLQERAVSRPGDIFDLGGRHRLGCGDARDQSFMGRVRDGLVADVCVADPPFNIPVHEFFSAKRRGRHQKFIQGAGELSDTEYFLLLRDSFECLKASSSQRALIYFFIDPGHILESTAAARLIDLPLVTICVWVKSNAGLGGIYRTQHELCCVFKAGNQPHRNNVELGRFGRNRSSVWTHPGLSSFSKHRDELLKAHPTPKPVALVADILRDVTTRGDVVLDPFSGSGTTIMAAEETGRRCCAVELDPPYVDVAIRRWQRATGQDAVHAMTGERFDDLAQRLLPPGQG